MSLPEFTIAIWVVPHRGYGHFVEVDAGDVDEGLPGGVFQSFEHVDAGPHHPRFEPDYPHRELQVTGAQVQVLVALADQILYGFAEHGFTPMLGGSTFGLRVTRAFQEATVVWHGRLEDQDPALCRLFRAVEVLCEA